MKKLFQNFVIFVLSLMIIFMTMLNALLVYVCFFTESTQKENTFTKHEYTEYTEYSPTAMIVKSLGRTYMKDGIRYLSMSGSGVEFRCKGEYVTFDIHGVNQQYQTSAQKARFAVYLNGIQIKDELVDYEKQKHRIDISGYTNGVTVKIMKLSEPQFSTMGIGKIGIYSCYDIEPAEKKELAIEFIGDSITCGYGIDEEAIYSYFSTATENFSKTYAYLTAENLNADVSTVAFSGYGVYSGFTTGGRNSSDVISKYYDTSVIVRGESMPWTFTEFLPDIVVINLGTNDASYCSRSYSGRQSFIAEYKNLIRTVREKNPKAYILCILGDMNNSLFPCIETAVAEYSAESYDYRVKAETIDFAMDETDIVIDGHPGVLANMRAAARLTAVIQELISSGAVKGSF